jgi:hypothetical protein
LQLLSTVPLGLWTTDASIVSFMTHLQTFRHIGPSPIVGGPRSPIVVVEIRGGGRYSLPRIPLERCHQHSRCCPWTHPPTTSPSHLFTPNLTNRRSTGSTAPPSASYTRTPYRRVQPPPRNHPLNDPSAQQRPFIHAESALRIKPNSSAANHEIQFPTNRGAATLRSPCL